MSTHKRGIVILRILSLDINKNDASQLCFGACVPPVDGGTRKRRNFLLKFSSGVFPLFCTLEKCKKKALHAGNVRIKILPECVPNRGLRNTNIYQFTRDSFASFGFIGKLFCAEGEKREREGSCCHYDSKIQNKRAQQTHAFNVHSVRSLVWNREKFNADFSCEGY